MAYRQPKRRKPSKSGGNRGPGSRSAEKQRAGRAGAEHRERVRRGGLVGDAKKQSEQRARDRVKQMREEGRALERARAARARGQSISAIEGARPTKEWRRNPLTGRFEQVTTDYSTLGEDRFRRGWGDSVSYTSMLGGDVISGSIDLDPSKYTLDRSLEDLGDYANAEIMDKEADASWEAGDYGDWLSSKINSIGLSASNVISDEISAIVNNPVDYAADLMTGPLGQVANMIAPGIGLAVTGIDAVMDYFQGENIKAGWQTATGLIAQNVPGMDPLGRAAMGAFSDPLASAQTLGGVLGGQLGAGLGGATGAVVGSQLGSIMIGKPIQAADISGVGIGTGAGGGGQRPSGEGQAADRGATITPSGDLVSQTTTVEPGQLRRGFVDEASDGLREADNMIKNLDKASFEELRSHFPTVALSGGIGFEPQAVESSLGFTPTPTGQQVPTSKIMIDPQLPDSRGYEFIQDGAILNRMIEPIPVLQ